MQVPGLYVFDEADDALSLLPMAARRALDLAGVHLSLAAWGTLARADRVALIALGAAEQVDATAVARVLEQSRAETTADAVRPDPDAAQLPSDVMALLDAARPLDDAKWRALRALDRYVLVKLASRGKRERLEVAYDEIVRADASPAE